MNRIEIYPNPFKDYINFSSIISKNKGYQFEIFNGNGELVKNGTNLGLSKVETNELPCGFYFVKIMDENTQYFLKIIKIEF